jgi:MFS family permease
LRFEALQNKDYALFWGLHVLSRVGSEMRMVAFSWHVYQLTGSKLALGIIGACRCVPVLVFGLWGGLIADRLDRRRVLLATQAFMAVVSAALFFLTRAGLVTPLAIYAAVALIASASAFEGPARASFVVNVLPREHLENGLALNVLGWQVATVVGPALGGIVLAATSLQALYAADAVSFLPLIGVLALIRARHGAPPAAAPDPDKRAAPTGLAAIADAVRYLRTKPVLIHLMWIDFLATLFAGALLLLPVFSTEVFHRGAEGLGWLMAAPAVGAVIAGTFLSSRPPIRRHGPALLGAVAAYGASMALFGVTSSFWIGLALLAASGAADTVSTVVRQVARQTMIPDEMRGRLNAIHMLFFVSGPQLGELEAGALAEVTSARFSVVTGGLACLALALGATALSPTVRTLRVAAPAAEPVKA